MQQIISREEQKVGDRQPAQIEFGQGDPSVREVSKESHSYRGAQVSGGFLGVTYERFWQMPIPVVLTVLWLIGMALLSSCVLTLYTLGTLLVSMVGA